MLYKDFKGLQLSELGMGNMRLPTIGGDDIKLTRKRPWPSYAARMSAA